MLEDQRAWHDKYIKQRFVYDTFSLFSEAGNPLTLSNKHQLHFHVKVFNISVAAEDMAYDMVGVWARVRCMIDR